MKIAVIGLSRFIGRSLQSFLSEKGDFITYVSRQPFSSHKGLILNDRESYLHADINLLDHLPGLQLLLSKVDSIVFLPELRYFVNISDFLETNNPNVNIVALSSTAVFTQTSSPNKAWRKFAEKKCLSSSLAITVLRCNMIYGGCDDRNLSHLLRFCNKSKVVLVPTTLFLKSPTIQPLYIVDLLNFIYSQLTTHSLSKPRIYTLAGPQPISLRAYIKLIQLVLGKRILLIPVPYCIIQALLIAIYKVFRAIPFRYVEFLPRLMESKAIFNEYFYYCALPQLSYLQALCQISSSRRV